MSGRNFNPATAVLVTFDSSRGGRPESFQGRTDGFGRFTVEINPMRRPAGAYEVRADDFRQREAVVVFRVPCPAPDISGTAPPTAETPPPPTAETPPRTFTPVLRVEPPLGRPGFVTMAVGSGFPPNAPVTLTWSPGITATRPSPVVADAAGTFRATMLVFHRDRPGRRQLVATPAGDIAFPTVLTSFLVVPGTLQPPEFKNRR